MAMYKKRGKNIKPILNILREKRRKILSKMELDDMVSHYDSDCSKCNARKMTSEEIEKYCGKKV